MPYDTLLVSGGSSYAYFGHDEWRSVALEVKSLDSALRDARADPAGLRGGRAGARPRAAQRLAYVRRRGRGPDRRGDGRSDRRAGARHAARRVPRERRRAPPGAAARNGADRVLTAFPQGSPPRRALARSASGVTPMLDHTGRGRREADSVGDEAGDGTRTRVATRTVIWAAGVTASPLARGSARRRGRRSTAPVA